MNPSSFIIGDATRVIGEHPLQNEEANEMKVSTIGIDLAKRVFQAHGVDQHGKCILRTRLSRAELAPVSGQP